VTATMINRNISDLHTDDYLNRLRMQDWLREEQKRQGISDKELSSRVGHHSSWSHGVMESNMWRVATLQKAVRALGYELKFNVKIDVKPGPIEKTPYNPKGLSNAEKYANSPNLSHREEADRVDLTDLGRRLREASNLTPAMLGHRLRCDGSTVTAWESGEKPFYLLVTAQRFFRALGGELKMVITKIEDNGTQRIFEAPEGRWPSATEDVVNIVQLPQHTMIWNSNAPETVVSFPAAAWKAWLKAND
jgi:hypothetical protein